MYLSRDCKSLGDLIFSPCHQTEICLHGLRRKLTRKKKCQMTWIYLFLFINFFYHFVLLFSHFIFFMLCFLFNLHLLHRLLLPHYSPYLTPSPPPHRPTSNSGRQSGQAKPQSPAPKNNNKSLVNIENSNRYQIMEILARVVTIEISKN